MNRHAILRILVPYHGYDVTGEVNDFIHTIDASCMGDVDISFSLPHEGRVGCGGVAPDVIWVYITNGDEDEFLCGFTSEALVTILHFCERFRRDRRL